MSLNNFIYENYPGLELRPSLFYSWSIGIRFVLGVAWQQEYE